MKDQTTIDGKKRFVWRLREGDEPVIAEMSSPFAAKTLSKLGDPPLKKQKVRNRLFNNGNAAAEGPKESSQQVNGSNGHLTDEDLSEAATPPIMEFSSPLKSPLMVLSSIASDTNDSCAGKEESDMEDTQPEVDYVQLIIESLKVFQGKASTADIVDHILNNQSNGTTITKKKLRYLVSATLSSKKYAALFGKELDGDKLFWELKEEVAQVV